jgi:hypothetical protein
MRLLKYINEEYLMRLTTVYGKNSYEVFINPSAKEMRELDTTSLGVRFLADSRDKTVYVWDADKAIHYEAWEFIKPKDIMKFGNLVEQLVLLPGNAEKVKGKYAMTRSDRINDRFLYQKMKAFKKKFKWVNKYIDLSILDEWEKEWEEYND